MDEFTYVNLFDTKGIEYIIIIAFLLIIIPFWKLLNRPLKPEARKADISTPLSASITGVPQGLYFSNTHTWAHLLRSGEARLGIDRLLISLTGGVDLKMLLEPGNRVKKGEELTELVRDGKRLILVSPISGTVAGINQDLFNDPSILQKDPYGQGWICSVKPEHWITEVAGFRIAADATAWLRNELRRTKDFMVTASGRLNRNSQALYLQDGGEPAGESLALLPGEVWKDFQKEFLN